MSIFSGETIVGITKALKFSVVIVLMLSAAFSGHAQPLIALTATDKDMTGLADATMAKLSEQNVLFVERIKIDRVIKEQNLSASGLVKPDSLIRTGVILRADIIVVFTKTFAQTRFIAFDVKTGIRLQDSLSANTDFETMLAWASTAVLNSIEKYKSISTNNAILFSFLPVNLISLNKAGIVSAEKTEILLKQELLKNKNYLVLERDQVSALVKEKIISQSKLDKLLPGSYVAELEARADDASGNILAVNLILSQNKIEKIAPIKVTYSIGTEKAAVLKIVDKLKHSLKEQTTTLPATRKSEEALAYLEDSKAALKNFDTPKSILSAKNAYMLDSALKNQVNELLTKNYYYIGNQLKACKYGFEKGTKDYNKFMSSYKSVFDIMDFYKTINGQPITPWILHVSHLSVLPENLQKEITQSYNEYFSERLALIKQQYDYKKEPPGSFEYLLKYKDYLNQLKELTNVTWTCAYWLKYMAPELVNYLDEVECLYKKDPHEKKMSALVVPVKSYIRSNKFYSKDNEFNNTAFDKASQILQRMFKSPIINWNVAVIMAVNGMVRYYENYMRFSVNSDPYTKYGVSFVKKIRQSPLIRNTYSKKSQYKFASYFLDKAPESPDYIRDSIIYFFRMCVHGPLLKNKKELDTTLYVKTVKAKLPMDKLMAEFSHEQLIKLKEATKNIDNPEFKKLLERYIGYKTRKDEPECNPREYLLERKKLLTIKEIFKTNSYGTRHRSVFYPTKAFLEKNTIYVPLYSGNFAHFALAKIVIANKIETTISNLKECNIRLPGSSNSQITCMGTKNIFFISGCGIIVIYPKNIALPLPVKVSTIANSRIESACFLNGKVYICIRTEYDKKQPTKIIEFDPQSKTSRVVFSEKQTVNNPFKSLKFNIRLQGEMLTDTNKNCLLMTVENNLWDFYPKTGTWKNNGKKLYTGTPSTIFDAVAKTFLVFAKGDMMKLVDIGPKRDYINNFTKSLGLKPEQYKDYSSLEFKLKQGNKFVYLSDLVPDGTILYRKNTIFFLKQKKIVKLENDRILLPFTIKQKQYYISSRYFSRTENDLELWINTVNPDPAKANDFDKIVVYEAPKSNFTSSKLATQSREELLKSIYETPYYISEYININAPSWLPKDFYYPGKVFVEKNIIFVPNYSKTFKYFYLMKMDLANGLKTTFGKLGELKTNLSVDNSNAATCIGDSNIFMVSPRGAIISFPKNGSSPKITLLKELDRKMVRAACFLDSKVYIFLRSGKYPNTLGTIVQFDPRQETLKYIFVANQTENNPFKKPDSFILQGDFWADKTNNSIILFAKDSGFWRFFPADGKWQKIELQNNELNYSSCCGKIINGDFFALANNKSMKLFDFSKDKNNINSFSQATGLKPKQCADYSVMDFTLKSNGNIIPLVSHSLDNDNLIPTFGWGSLYILKSSRVINSIYRQIASFVWNGKQHFLFIKINNNTAKFNYCFWIETIKPDAKRGNDFELVSLNQ